LGSLRPELAVRGFWRVRVWSGWDGGSPGAPPGLTPVANRPSSLRHRRLPPGSLRPPRCRGEIIGHVWDWRKGVRRARFDTAKDAATRWRRFSYVGIPSNRQDHAPHGRGGSRLDREAHAMAITTLRSRRRQTPPECCHLMVPNPERPRTRPLPDRRDGATLPAWAAYVDLLLAVGLDGEDSADGECGPGAAHADAESRF
jgi:hypothetical protein